VQIPAPRTPARADWAGRLETLRGRRLAIATTTEVREDVVAWSDLITDDVGALWVEVVQEADWWRFVLLGFIPVHIVRWPAGAVWTTGPEVDQATLPR